MPVTRRDFLKTSALASLAALAPKSAAAIFRGGAPNPNTIGGIAIGTAGSSGIYTGYTMEGGDDFTNALNVVNINNPNGRYFSTHIYAAGARTASNLYGYDMDPFHTGAQDSNRGVPVGSTNMNQANSLLTLQARLATGAETPYINGKSVVDAMIHTGGYIGVTAPCIMEALVSVNAPSTQTDWHPTSVWNLNTSPLTAGVTGAPGSLEFDAGETYNPSAFNFNAHGTTTGPGSEQAGTLSILDGQMHLYSMVMTASGMTFYLDGTKVGNTILQDCTNTAAPFYALFTNHLTAYTASQWNSSQTATIVIDYYRFWVPTSQTQKSLAPLEALPYLQVAHGTSMNYQFPTPAALWGSGFSGTDYCQGIKNEDFEPGSSTQGTGNYTQFPAGLTWNPTTRALTGVTSDGKPGRINVSAMPYLSGGAVVYPARGQIDVGPIVNTTTLNATHGVAYSYDLYFDCDCGTLVPKTITCTGLPTGLNLVSSPTFYGISGTPTTAGTYPLVIGVTNASGQVATKNVNLVVS